MLSRNYPPPKLQPASMKVHQIPHRHLGQPQIVDKLRIHAFISLIFAAMLVGILSPVPLDPESSLWQPVLAMRMTAEAFGKTAGSIGIIIVLASIIGKCLLDSGAADRIA